MFAHYAVRRNITYKVNITAKGNIICPQGQTSFGVPALSQVAVRCSFPTKRRIARKSLKMTVKIAKPEDFNKLRELYRLYSKYYSKLIPEQFNESEGDETVFRFIAQEESMDVTYAENDTGEVFGMLLLRVCHTEPSPFRRNKTYLYLSELYLKDKACLEPLLDAAVKWGAERGCEYIDIDLPALDILGRELKEKYGFSESYASYSKPIPEELRLGAKPRKFANIEKMLADNYIK